MLILRPRQIIVDASDAAQLCFLNSTPPTPMPADATPVMVLGSCFPFEYATLRLLDVVDARCHAALFFRHCRHFLFGFDHAAISLPRLFVSIERRPKHAA